MYLGGLCVYPIAIKSISDVFIGPSLISDMHGGRPVPQSPLGRLRRGMMCSGRPVPLGRLRRGMKIPSSILY